MRIKYPVKKKKSFKENIIHILPMMFDNMMRYKAMVAGHPRMKNQLHRMRISGKPIRYLMEIMDSTFGKEFKNCLMDIKGLIELMGDIHDCDVFVTELNAYITELRAYNRTKHKSYEKFNTSEISKLINELKEKRNNAFHVLCQTFDKWDKENIREKLINSMKSDKINEINYFKTVS